MDHYPIRFSEQEKAVVLSATFTVQDTQYNCTTRALTISGLVVVDGFTDLPKRYDMTLTATGDHWEIQQCSFQPV